MGLALGSYFPSTLFPTLAPQVGLTMEILSQVQGMTSLYYTGVERGGTVLRNLLSLEVSWEQNYAPDFETPERSTGSDLFNGFL